jgi:hypothetical protein
MVRRRTLHIALIASIASLAIGAGAARAEKPFRVYPSFEGHADTDLPPDFDVPAEFVIGRLMYPSSRGFFGGSGWESGGTSWAVDYPRGDRKLAEVLRRFTRTDVRSVEQPVNPNDGNDIYDWPFLMVGLAGYWQLTDEHVAALRAYLLRGGFLFADSFFGSDSWVGFQEGLQRVFPDRPIIDLRDDHPVFHTVYDIPAMTTVQIPNMNAVGPRRRLSRRRPHPTLARHRGRRRPTHGADRLQQ